MDSASFTIFHREQTIGMLDSLHFDMIIIGGGITGSGIALDAVSRGLRVALLERKDFASGTSSRSGKLIHGGLKYLQKFDLPVVRETGREREIVYRNALHLVYPIKMNFPLVKNEAYNILSLKVGLSVYDRLAGVKKSERHRMHGRKQTFHNEPLFNRETVKGSGMYVEYRTDDSRLTMEVAKTAAERGATILNYAEVIGFLKDGSDRIAGVEVLDRIGGRRFSATAKYIVNAAGPWVDIVRKLDGPVKGKKVLLAKGIHIVLDRSSLPVQSPIYFQHKGRMIAVIPVDDRVYVGSTETAYDEDMDDIRVQHSEVSYLIGCLEDMFPSIDVSVEDVISSWAGIRPLIGEEGKPPAELSRHDEIFESDSGLITIAGGKLTGYRKMAERVMRYIEKKETIKENRSHTDSIRLSGSQFGSASELEYYQKELYRKYADLDLSEEDIRRYVMRYGTNSGRMLEYVADYRDRHPDKQVCRILGELKYTIDHEMVTALPDFYDRRTSYQLFYPEKVAQSLDAVADEMARLLRWKEDKKDEEKRKILAALHNAVAFKSPAGGGNP